MTSAAIQDPVPSADSVRIPKYRVCVLYYGAIDPEHSKCIDDLKDHPNLHSVMKMTGCPYIDQGRSICATAVLDNPSIDGVVFFDHDMLFDVAEFGKLIESVEASEGVVGAAYSMRRPGKIIGAIDGSKIPAGKQVVFFEGGDRFAAIYLGMGMTAIHRRSLERLVAASEGRYARQQENLKGLLHLLATSIPVEAERAEALRLLDALRPELRDKDLPRMTTGISDADCIPFFSHLQRRLPSLPHLEGTYFGEDVSFCIRAHEAFIPVELDTRLRVYHKGSYPYGLEDVGMQVPYCTRLEVLDVGAREPEARPSFHSSDARVQQALDTAYPGGVLPEVDAPALPPSFDPVTQAVAS